MENIDVIYRHVGDASFYWSQIDKISYSNTVTIDGVLNFEKILTAHLDGVIEANRIGWDISLNQLERWRGAGEIFVCSFIALSSPPELSLPKWKIIEKILIADPYRMLRGVVSAILRLKNRESRNWIIHFLKQRDSDLTKIIAWRCLAASSNIISQVDKESLYFIFRDSLNSENKFLRVSACRAIHSFDSSAEISKLYINDEEFIVSAEAGIISSQYDNCNYGIDAIWRAIYKMATISLTQKGYDKFKSLHSLNRLVRYFGIFSPIGHPSIPKLLDILPTRLSILFLINHADPRYLPWIKNQLINPECSRLAGWAWSALCGIDIEKSNLTYPPMKLDSENINLTDDLDPGLPLPIFEKINAIDISSIPDESYLYFHFRSLSGCLNILKNGPQSLRWAASQRIKKFQNDDFSSFSIKSDARSQLIILNKY